MDVTIIIHLWKEATYITIINYPSSSPQPKAHPSALADFLFGVKIMEDESHETFRSKNDTHTFFLLGAKSLEPKPLGPLGSGFTRTPTPFRIQVWWPASWLVRRWILCRPVQTWRRWDVWGGGRFWGGGVDETGLPFFLPWVVENGWKLGPVYCKGN